MRLWNEIVGWWLHRRAWRKFLRDVDGGKYGDWRPVGHGELKQVAKET